MMIQKVLKTITATVLIISMTALTALADDVTDLTNKKNNAQQELDNSQNELAYLLVQMDELEVKMADASDRLDAATKDLAAAEQKQQEQYQDMKLRIKYMYEDQTVSMLETIITAEDMGQVLNKAEYMQQVYEYDRNRLNEFAQVAEEIAATKADIEQTQTELAEAQADLTEKQSLLYTTIAEKEKTVKDFSNQLDQAVKAAAARSAANSATAATVKNTYVPSGNASVGENIVAKAFEYLGTPYRSGGASPGGFDCSGFTSYVFGQFGIGLSRASSSQAYGGMDVGGIGNALPGDIVCYPGHVGIYIGNGQIIHASVPGDYVKVASAYIMNITSVRRYW